MACAAHRCGNESHGQAVAEQYEADRAKAIAFAKLNGYHLARMQAILLLLKNFSQPYDTTRMRFDDHVR